jgi:hypothetical protein
MRVKALYFQPFPTVPPMTKAHAFFQYGKVFTITGGNQSVGFEPSKVSYKLHKTLTLLAIFTYKDYMAVICKQ